MKTITIKVKLTDEQFALISDEAVKRKFNRAQTMIAQQIQKDLKEIIDWSNTDVDSNSVLVSAKTEEDV